MAEVVRSSVRTFNLASLSDKELDTVIANSQAQVADMNRFLNLVINERVRRGLRLAPDREQDEQISQF